MVVMWVVVVVVVDDNDVVIDLADIDLNIDYEEEEQWGIYVSARGGTGGRWGIYVGTTPLCLLFLLQCYSVFASTLEEEEEASEASMSTLCSNSQTITSSSGTMDLRKGRWATRRRKRLGVNLRRDVLTLSSWPLASAWMMHTALPQQCGRGPASGLALPVTKGDLIEWWRLITI